MVANREQLQEILKKSESTCTQEAMGIHLLYQE